MVSSKNVIYTCPTSNEQFKGICPCKKCPANVSNIRPEKSGCVYLLLPKGTKIDKFSLAYIFREKIRDANEITKRGRRKIKQALFFSTLLDELKKPNETACPKCGVTKTTIGECLNVVKCNIRRRQVKRLRCKFPFNLQTLNVTKERMLRFSIAINNWELSSLNFVKRTSTPLYKLLGVKPKVLKRVKALTKEI